MFIPNVSMLGDLGTVTGSSTILFGPSGSVIHFHMGHAINVVSGGWVSTITSALFNPLYCGIPQH